MPDSKIRTKSGKLKKVYHGRTSQFNSFSKKFANISGDFGKGYYFSFEQTDSAKDYGEEGVNLTVCHCRNSTDIIKRNL